MFHIIRNCRVNCVLIDKLFLTDLNGDKNISKSKSGVLEVSVSVALSHWGTNSDKIKAQQVVEGLL